MTKDSGNDELARTLLSLWDIPASDDEIAVFAAGLPAARATVSRLHAVPTGDDESALSFGFPSY